MNTTTRYVFLIVSVVCLGSLAAADTVPWQPDWNHASPELGALNPPSDGTVVSSGVGTGLLRGYASDVVGTSFELTDYFLLEEPGLLIGALIFPRPGAAKAAAQPQTVPEPSTWILLLLGLGILLATQRTVPVNLRSVHSCLRARRGHAPIR